MFRNDNLTQHPDATEPESSNLEVIHRMLRFLNKIKSNNDDTDESLVAQHNKILLVHGLEHVTAINCDKVFNLFCLYGNVAVVKILKDQKVFVEMDDDEGAKRCVKNLHMLPLDEQHKLRVK